MAGKKGSGSGWLVIVGLALALIASVPKEIWIAFGVFAAIGGVIYFFSKSKTPSTALTATRTEQSAFRSEKVPSAAEWERPTQPVPFPTTEARPEEKPIFVASSKPPPSNFAVPAPPKGFGPAKWTPPGTSVEVGGLWIPGGMVYVGTVLKTPYGDDDPCLIDPFKTISVQGDFTERQTNYWPSYSQISGAARRAYLNWLAGGKKHPEADIGYVFLYFYGLERRVILDAPKDAVAQAELPAIGQEIERLLGIYGEKSNSFRNYASELLGWVKLSSHSAALYNQPVPEFPRTWEIPVYLRLALGQAAMAGVPLPAHLALAWVKFDPSTKLRTPATRCAREFAKLFELKYAAAFGTGMVLPKNKTKLKLVYRPASGGFRGYGEIKLSFGDTPDVTVLTAPIKKLHLLAEDATKELEPYSRAIGRNPSAAASLESLLQLPVTLWPERARKVLNDLKSRVGVVGMITTLTLQDLLSTLATKPPLTRDKVQGLARVLESMGVAMEPDVLGGAASPKPEDKVILFAINPMEPIVRNAPAFQAALLTLQLASGVAAVDGDFGEQEMSHLRAQVESWTHLTPGHHQRLLAHLKLLASAPVPLSSLKKRLDPLPATSKEAIASFMATVAQADGTVSPAEVKMLEKVYKVLGVDSKKVFSDVHAATSGSVPVSSVTGTASTGFKLDPARIAALQKDTERVSALLAGIFTEDEAPRTPVPEQVDDTLDPETAPPHGLLGLDEAHTSLVRMLLSRPQWSRQELLDVAEDLELMLDGALERINEASFDAHDMPLTEGDDPVEVRTDALEKIEA